jgi:hypothetical protein
VTSVVGTHRLDGADDTRGSQIACHPTSPGRPTDMPPSWSQRHGSWRGYRGDDFAGLDAAMDSVARARLYSERRDSIGRLRRPLGAARHRAASACGTKPASPPVSRLRAANRSGVGCVSEKADQRLFFRHTAHLRHEREAFRVGPPDDGQRQHCRRLIGCPLAKQRSTVALIRAGSSGIAGDPAAIEELTCHGVELPGAAAGRGGDLPRSCWNGSGRCRTQRRNQADRRDGGGDQAETKKDRKSSA